MQISAAHSGSPARAGNRRRLGVMGGTFDPIHHGHLVAASEVADLFGLDEVVFVPTGNPWQKSARKVSHAEDRYLMTVVATASNPRFSVSRVDIDRPGTTYTVDTLRDLRDQHGDAEMYFITGADAISSILTWQRWEELFELAKFVGVTRPGYELDVGPLEEILHGHPADTVSVVEIPALAISSTECRERAARSRPVWYLVPDGVVQYIAKRNLYRPSSAVRDDGTMRTSAPSPAGGTRARVPGAGAGQTPAETRAATTHRTSTGENDT